MRKHIIKSAFTIAFCAVNFEQCEQRTSATMATKSLASQNRSDWMGKQTQRHLAWRQTNESEQSGEHKRETHFGGVQECAAEEYEEKFIGKGSKMRMRCCVHKTKQSDDDSYSDRPKVKRATTQSQHAYLFCFKWKPGCVVDLTETVNMHLPNKYLWTLFGVSNGGLA